MKKNLIGTKVNKWTVIKEVEADRFDCVCECGRHKIISRNALVSKRATSCGLCDFKPLTGTFNEWTILKYIGNKQYLCRCSCGTEAILDSYTLKSGRSKSCGHNKEDLTGKTFGEWKVIERDHNSFWLCECSCGTRQVIQAKYLKSGRTTHCKNGKHRFTDLTGKVFGEWKVLSYAGDYKWLCKCSCGTERIVCGSALVAGKSKSCGCVKYKHSIKTMVERYGDLAPARVNNPRDEWQLEVLYDKDSFIKYLKSLGFKPTANDLSRLLDTDSNVVLKTVHKYNALDYIDYTPSVSDQEKEVFEFVKSVYSGEIKQSDRTVLTPYELDIYIPDKKLAIEFNGSYWHSDDQKDYKYHQRKTIECAKVGIRLIHIFEYEWDDINKRDKIERYLKDILVDNNRVYGRDTILKEISLDEALKFEDKYHISGHANSIVNIALMYNNEILSVMTFGKPRFTSDYEYELIRYCCKSGVTVVGGAEKLFKYFTDTYKPNSILCYSDISKFTGNIYTRLGFRCTIDDITQPNYVWVNTVSKDIKSRYQTTKQKLVKDGCGTESMTESDIMKRLGYVKVYDSGNLRLVWKRSEQGKLNNGE